MSDFMEHIDTEELEAEAKKLGVELSAMNDIGYLRTRHRWTPELEAELIRLHNAGTPPNIMEFGVTEQTQAALMKAAEQ